MLFDLKRQEQTDEESEVKWNALKWQTYVVTLAIVKFLVVSMLDSLRAKQFTANPGPDAYYEDYLLTRATQCFTLMLFGNVIDNNQSQKRIVIVVEIILASIYAFKAILLALGTSEPLFYITLTNTSLACTAVS